jgi:hypothetical protein
MDFCEHFNARRDTDQFDCPSNHYSWARVQEDLADGTFKIINFGCEVSLGEVLAALDEFAPSLEDSKKYVRMFLDKDYIALKDEY